MSRHTRASHPIYNLLPTDIEGFNDLAELALDMRWSWNHAADHVWPQLDPVLWELTHNPWGILQTVSREKSGRFSQSRFPQKAMTWYKPSGKPRRRLHGFSKPTRHLP